MARADAGRGLALTERLASTLLAVVVSTFGCPDHARCVAGWYLNGVRPSGEFECRPVLGDAASDLDDARARRDFHDERAVRGRIYCTGGSHPVIGADGASVGCQR